MFQSLAALQLVLLLYNVIYSFVMTAKVNTGLEQAHPVIRMLATAKPWLKNLLIHLSFLAGLHIVAASTLSLVYLLGADSGSLVYLYPHVTIPCYLITMHAAGLNLKVRIE